MVKSIPGKLTLDTSEHQRGKGLVRAFPVGVFRGAAVAHANGPCRGRRITGSGKTRWRRSCRFANERKGPEVRNSRKIKNRRPVPGRRVIFRESFPRSTASTPTSYLFRQRNHMNSCRALSPGSAYAAKPSLFGKVLLGENDFSRLSVLINVIFLLHLTFAYRSKILIRNVPINQDY